MVHFIRNEYTQKKIDRRLYKGNYEEILLDYFINFIPDYQSVLFFTNTKKILKKEELFNENLKNGIKSLAIHEINRRISIEEIIITKEHPIIPYKFYSIQKFDAIYSLNDVTIIKYILNPSISEKLKETIRTEFYKEANFYEILNYPIKQSENISDYFGCINTQESFSLILKFHKINLMSFIQQLIIQDHDLKMENLTKMLISLIESFILMQQKNIVYRKVHPESFFIENDFSINIMNFLFAVNKEENFKGRRNDFMHENDPSYFSPEEIKEEPGLDLEKCNVYSLGLIFLQMIFRKNIEIIREKVDLFLGELKERSEIDKEAVLIGNFLGMMLRKTPEARLSFNDLVDAIQEYPCDYKSFTISIFPSEKSFSK